jgi:hypothetical protein
VGCVKGILCGLLLLLSPAAWAGDELASGKMADGTSVPYVLTTGGGTPAYALILMPGGVGVLSPHLHNDGSVAFQNERETVDKIKQWIIAGG